MDELFNAYFKNESFKEPEDTIYYLIASNGVFKVKKTTFFVSSSAIMISVEGRELPGLQKHFASVRINLPKKVSDEILKSSLSFFRAVYQKYERSEAIVILYWSPAKREYLIRAPKQEVIAMSLPYYEVGENPWGLVRVGTIHSHCDAPAFHSKVDEADEAQDDGIHITIGNINSNPSYSCAIVSDGQRLSVGIEKVVDCDLGGEFPSEWLRNVRLAPKPKIVPGKNQGHRLVKYFVDGAPSDIRDKDEK